MLNILLPARPLEYKTHGRLCMSKKVRRAKRSSYESCRYQQGLNQSVHEDGIVIEYETWAMGNRYVFAKDCRQSLSRPKIGFAA